MSDRSLISVIIPAYNAEKTLGKCVESVLCQEYTEFELILVDDGSKDRTAVICDDYASRDVRIKVIHKSNSGVGAARNSGLELAKGEFISFIDSDDEVKRLYLSNLIDNVNDDVDLVVSNASVFKYGEWVGEKYVPLVVEGDEFDEFFAQNVLHTSPWSKLYRTSVIKDNGISFPTDMSIGEDAVFLLTCIAHSRAVVVTEDSDYLYNSADGNLTKKLYGYDKEVYISKKIDEAVDGLVIRKNINSSLAVQHLNLIKSLYRERVLDSIYMLEDFSRKQRMNAIKSLDTSSMRVFSYKQCGFRSWLLSHLLKWRMFCEYDTLRSLTKKIKRY